MSDSRQDAPSSEIQVKVVDRRRFRADGDPLPEGEAASDPTPASPEAGAQAAEPDERDARIASQQARIDELLRAYAALVEDNKSFRQRQEREKVRVIDAERASIAQALLEAADDLERALSAVGSADVKGKAIENLVEGVRLSLGALHKRIAELGAERLSVAGLPFDPRLAEAVDTVPVADADQDGCVVQEIRPGYRIGDRVLRPARVRVGRLAQA